MRKFNVGDRVRIIGLSFTGHIGTIVSHFEGARCPSVRLDSGQMTYFFEDDLELLSDEEQDERCTTHHHACDCREAAHKEVADALDVAISWLEGLMWHSLEYTETEINDALSSFRDVLERYKEMHP